jgi:RNA-directed DNA polymerase
MKASLDCDKTKTEFASLKSRSDVAHLLALTDRALRYRLYGLKQSNQYTSFEIRKKSGGTRIILAPDRILKRIQRQLLAILECVYEPKNVVHGFNIDRSIKTNAQQHPKSRWLLNVDISEFFPSINFGRVRGMFMASPYKCTAEVATVLSQICCFENQLPQGAPTSPIVSNMLCARLDAHMIHLAGRYKCTYTRYADDITLSTFQNSFPKDLAELKKIDGKQRCFAGPRLMRVMRRNGFKLNSSKSRLSDGSQRQEVTGLVVNLKVNVPRMHVREVRAMLHNLGKVGLTKCQSDFISKYCRRHRAPGSPTPLFIWVLRGKIDYLGMIRGKEDPLYRKLLKRFDELVPGVVKVPAVKDEIDALFEHLWVVTAETSNGDIMQGTGFMLKDVGLVTASHVLGKGKIGSLRVQSFDGQAEYEASVAKRDGVLDLAILRIEGFIPDGGLEASKLKPARKTPVTLLGFPNHNVGDQGHFDQGIITSFRKHPYSDDQLFLINCKIVEGNSGGPVLDNSSKVLGIALRGGANWREAEATDFHAVMPVGALERINSH